MEFKEKSISIPNQTPETNRNIEIPILEETNVRTEVPKEVENWLEEIEKDPIQTTIINPQNKQPVLVPVSSTNQKVTLPITRVTFVKGFAKTVSDLGLWLSNFILRQIKIKKGNVLFKHQSE
jgi:hypothetical protein